MKIQKSVYENMVKEKACFKKVFEVDGRYVNDHCFVVKDDLIHVFYIDGEVGKGCMDLGNEVIVGHAVSSNLMEWKEEKPALVYEPSLYHEERGIFAPYVILKDGIYHMYYASHNLKYAQYMCLAFSSDLYTWERYESNPLFVPSSWALWKEDIPCSCRDAHVFFDSGLYVMYWVGDVDGDTSCIAASVSADLVNWEDKGPVLKRRHSVFESLVMKTESPCLIKNHGLYYLFFRHGNGTRYCISDNCLDFNFSDAYFLSSSHASEIFQYGNNWYISSCSRDILDICHSYDRTKGLYLAGLSWEKLHPYVIDINYIK